MKATSAEHKDKATGLKAELASLQEQNAELKRQLNEALADGSVKQLSSAQAAELAAVQEQELAEARVAYSQVSGQLERLTAEYDALLVQNEARLKDEVEAQARQTEKQLLLDEAVREGQELRSRLLVLEARHEEVAARLVASERCRDEAELRLADVDGALAAREDEVAALRERLEAQGRELEEARREAEAGRIMAGDGAREAEERAREAEERVREAEAKAAALKEKLGVGKGKYLKLQATAQASGFWRAGRVRGVVWRAGCREDMARSPRFRCRSARRRPRR